MAGALPHPRILHVIRTASIGDFLLTLPALGLLRRHFSTASIELMVHPLMRAIADSGQADTLSTFDDYPMLDALFRRGGDLPVALVSRLAAFDLIVWYGQDRDGTVHDHLSRMGAGQVWIANPFPLKGPRRPVSEHYCAALQPFGLSGEGENVTLSLSPQACSRAAARIASLKHKVILALHPGSGSEAKNWSAAGFASLVRQLGERFDLGVVLLSGGCDQAAAANVLHHLAGLEVGWLPDSPLDEVAALLARCTLYVGNDSGISHLAAVMGAPTLVIFGPTDSLLWRPRGKQVVVVEKKGLPCHPCSREQSATCSPRWCLQPIEVTEVLAVAESMLSRHENISY